MKGYPIVLEIPVQWGEMDSLRHVNNSRYLTWFESARIAYFEALRGALPALGASVGGGEVGPILASVTCDYLRPVSYPATVKVGARVSEIGNSSVRMEYAVERADKPDEIHARGTSVIVLVKYATMEKVRVPDDVRGTIDAMEKKAAGPSA